MSESKPCVKPCCDGMAEHLKQRECDRIVPCGDAYAIPGCCGGGCYVLVGVRFCPFCGTPIVAAEAPR